MRVSQRNKRPIWYSNKIGEDKVGLEKVPLYSPPKKIWVNYAGARGLVNYNPFGAFTDYTHILISNLLFESFTEDTILWIDKEPKPIESDTSAAIGFAKLGYARVGALPQTEPYNFRVRRIAKTLNQVRYAVKAVDTNGNSQVFG